MRIWQQPFDIDLLNEIGRKTIGDAIGIRFTDFGDDWLQATMPVNENTVQPMRMLHGGASVVLAETLGSVASLLCLKDVMGGQSAVGVEVNANHLRGVPEGSMVTGTVRPVRIGRTLHVWQIEIHDDQQRLVCTSRLTTMIVG